MKNIKNGNKKEREFFFSFLGIVWLTDRIFFFEKSASKEKLKLNWNQLRLSIVVAVVGYRGKKVLRETICFTGEND